MVSTQLTVQSIPLAKIRPNPNNPRKVKSDEAVDKKARSLQANGQETAIKLRPLTPQERQADPDHVYELIDGELRYRGALKLGWSALETIVLNISAEEAQWKAVMSNEWEDVYWLSRYEAIESRLKSPLEPTQQKVADELGVNQASISRVSRVMALLTPASREAIYATCIKLGDDHGIPEVVVRTITDLGNPQRIEKALKVAIEGQMTEKDAKKLVSWVQAGNPPESYGDSGESVKVRRSEVDPSDPYLAYWEGLPEQVQVTRGKKGYRLVMELSPAEAVPVVYGAMSNWEHLKALAGEPNNPRYRNTLHQVHKDAVPLRKKEIADRAQAEVDRKVALKAKVDEKTLKEIEGLAARQKDASQAAVDVRPSSEQQNPNDQVPLNPPLSKEESRAPNDGQVEKGFMGKIGDFVQQKTGLMPQDLKEKAEGMLAKDAVQTVNYEVRKGMRNLLKDLF